MSPELKQAVKERVALGHSQEQIKAELQEAGYDDETITTVYSTTVSSSAESVASLPGAVDLFKQAWAFALSRPDLLVLLTVPTLLINGGAVMLQMGWSPMSTLSLIGLLLGFVAVMFVQFLLQLTLAHTALTTQHSETPSINSSWNWATSNVWPWLWVATLSACVVFGGFLLFVIPGVIVSFYIAFAMYAFIDEDTRGMSALQRSRALVTGNFWEILSRFVVFILIIFGLSIMFGIAAALLAQAIGVLGNGVGELAMSLFDAVLTGFASLLGVYFAAGLYMALKQKQKAATPITESKAYPVLGWLGAVAFIAIAAFGGFGIATFLDEVGPEGFDFEQISSGGSTAIVESQAELSPEQQEEFNAFMEEFGGEFDSF